MQTAQYVKAVPANLVCRNKRYVLNEEVTEPLDMNDEMCSAGLHFTTQDNLFYWARALRYSHVVDVGLCKDSTILPYRNDERKLKTDCFALKNLRSLADFSLEMDRKSLLKLAASDGIRNIMQDEKIHSSLRKDKEFIATALKTDGKLACDLTNEEISDPELQLLAVRYGGYKCLKSRKNFDNDYQNQTLNDAIAEGKVRSDPFKFFSLPKHQRERIDLQEIVAVDKHVFKRLTHNERKDHSVRMAAYNAHPIETVRELSFWERITFFYRKGRNAVL